ncbi:MAG: TonB-dependent receptor [Bacteroidetes bacterium]|nr:TonB-dependent receptor [Bacteroidota bacterium]MCW5897414.1 TonB-dependent receptor [Bacteroidota bacterium]
MKTFLRTVLPVLAGSVVQLYAQTGTITGTVVNRITQEPLPFANVRILGTQSGAGTSVDGTFSVAEVPVGTYQVQASLVGFAPFILTDVVVRVGKPADLKFQLQPADIAFEEVEASGRYFQKSPDAAVSIQQLSYEEIRRSPGGFEDVVRAISVLPGVAQVSPGRNDLVVRGGAPSENLFVVDNIEIPNINHFGTQGASGGPLSYINLDFVRETAFSTGGFGVRYGDRMSSVLTIDLRDGRSDKLGGKATISASQFGLNVEGPLDNNGTFVFSARRSYLDLIFKAAGFAFVPEYWDFLGRASYKIDNANRLTFLAVGAIDDVSFFNDDATKRFDNSRVLGTAQRQYASGVSWVHLFGNGFSTVTLGRSYVNYNGVQRDSLLVPFFTNRSKEGETSLRGDVVMQLPYLAEVSFGAQARYINFKANLGMPEYVTTFGDTLQIMVNNYAETGQKIGVYAQYSQRVMTHLQLTVGGRLDYFSMINKKTYLSPRGSITYDISDLTSISASAGMYYQNPSYIWLVANPLNRNLEAARADQYVLGVEHLLRADLKLRIEGFHKKYRNYPASVTRPYLVLSNTGGGFGGSDENFASYGLDHLVSGGRGRSYGIEFLLQKKLSEIPMYGLASLTLSSTKFTPLDGIERPGAFDQRVMFNVGGGYQFNERWEASAKFRFASGSPYTPFSQNGTQSAAAYNSSRFNNLHSLDIRVDRRWNFANWDLIVYLDIQNIYNNKAVSQIRWNAREQRAEVNESIGILPSIGISAEL